MPPFGVIDGRLTKPDRGSKESASLSEAMRSEDGRHACCAIGQLYPCPHLYPFWGIYASVTYFMFDLLIVVAFLVAMLLCSSASLRRRKCFRLISGRRDCCQRQPGITGCVAAISGIVAGACFSRVGSATPVGSGRDARGRLSFDRNEFRFQGEAAGWSLALLPLQFSHCWSQRGKPDPAIAAGELTCDRPVVQGGTVDVRYTFDFGPWRSQCRIADAVMHDGAAASPAQP
jgi:hypothetical protein